MKVTQKQLGKMISESLDNVLNSGKTEFNPYDYHFNGMSDEEFNSFYEDEDEAEMERQLVDLVSDGEMLFKNIREMIEGSNFYMKNKENEKIKKYLEKIDSITDSIENFFW